MFCLTEVNTFKKSTAQTEYRWKDQVGRMNSKSVLLFSALAMLASAPVAAEYKGAAAVAPQELKAKTDY